MALVIKVRHPKREYDLQEFQRALPSLFLQRFLFRVYASYVSRARGGNDDLGNVWKPLAPSTIAKKMAKISVRRKIEEFRRGKFGRLFPVSFERERKRTFSLAYRRFVLTHNEIEARRLAEEVARSEVGPRAVLRTVIGVFDEGPLIMVDTGRLLTSFAPGEVVDGNYVPSGPDQKIIKRGRVLRFESEVPYGKYADRDRPVIPANVEPWVEYAIAKAIPAALRFARRRVGRNARS